MCKECVKKVAKCQGILRFFCRLVKGEFFVVIVVNQDVSSFFDYADVGVGSESVDY